MYLIFLITLFLPLLYQIIWGFKAVYHPSKLSLSLVAVITLVSHIAISIIANMVTSSQLSAEGQRCGMPLAALLFLCIALFVLIFVVLAIQAVVRWWVWRPAKQTFDN